MRNRRTMVNSGQPGHSETLTPFDRIMIGKSDAVRGDISGIRTLLRRRHFGLISPAGWSQPERTNSMKTMGKRPPEDRRFSGVVSGISEGTRICRL
jgi:hypothetical protein